MKIKKILILFIFLVVISVIIAVKVLSSPNTNTGANTNISLSNNPTMNSSIDKLNDKSERNLAFQIPENTLKTIETDALIDEILKYPYLMDIYAYDKYEQGFETIVQDFNGLKEFLQREDCAKKLFSRYKKMVVLSAFEKGKEMEMFDITNIEIILGQDCILNKLSSSEKEELKKEVEIKYIEKKKYPNIYGNNRYLFSKLK